MIADGSLSLEFVSFDRKPWYEIDTVEDLAEAENLFLEDEYEDIQEYAPTQHDVLLNASNSPWETIGAFNGSK
jgi:NDP-sugar pyrophosphorylase family protein